MKRPKSKPVPQKNLEETKASIPISREKLFRLHDIADGLRLLGDAEAAPEMQLIQTELLIIKTARWAQNLIHEEFDSRWEEYHPDLNLIRRS